MFTHLHVHTEYSLLDGMCRIDQLVARAKEMGMDSLAITDHGVMYGVIEFYQAARAQGIKPIIGCEIYIAPGSRHGRTAEDKNAYHLILLAKNQTGYENLIKLTTLAHLEGFYYKPRVDKELLGQYHEGLVALSACLSGEVSRMLSQNRHDDARQAARWYKETFGDFFLEIMRHPMPEMEAVNPRLIELGKELDIPLVATNDTHYLEKDDASAHDLLLCIGTNSSVNDEKRLKMPGDFFYLKSPEEMAKQYQDIPDALENTGRIADMCNLELEFGRLHLPEIERPAGKTPDEYLAELCREGFKTHYPEPTPELEKRLEYELDVIKTTRFANYFLVCWDIITFVKQNNIAYGVRGSAASSMVLYCLGITFLDPIEHGLVFERFLNIERKEMPDIDLDLQDTRREEVINYVSRKYGQDHVAQIITFGTLGARASIRDVGRALGMPYGDVDRVARLVPAMPGMTLARAMEENAELKELYRNDEIVRRLVNQAMRVEGISRHASTHAAGVVISSEPLTKYVPLQRGAKVGESEAVMTQFAMGDIARIGLLKMDFLGLINLTLLDKATEIIRRERGSNIDLLNIPMDDKKTYELLASGETAGVFQLEGGGMRRYIKELKPTVYNDITSMVALYRPGPMEHIPTFIEAKHGRAEIKYPHPALENILKDTYGVIVFQDQVLFIVRQFAGYSLGQADIFRKAMGKKIASVMQKEKANFLDGAKKLGYTDELANQVFELIEPFAGYAFNRAHSASYALIAYQTAYLKANYPVEYYTAFLTVHAGETEKLAGANAECRKMHIEILPPDINRSRHEFTIETNGDGNKVIRFGLSGIKNVGDGAIESIIKERDENGPFASIEDFCRRVDIRAINKRVVESLVKSGAMDRFDTPENPAGPEPPEWRGTLLNNIDQIVGLAQREQKLRDSGQSTMFDLFGETVSLPLNKLDMAPASVSSREKAVWEKELTGISFSEKPFSPVFRDESADAFLCGDVTTEMDKRVVVTAGRLISVRYSFTKKGEQFAIAVMEDISGQLEVLVWPRVYDQTQELWEEGSELVIQGKVRVREDQLSLVCDSASFYEAPPEGTGSEPVSVSRGETPPVPPPSRNDTAAAAPVGATNGSARPAQRLVISLKQTDDADADLALLNQVTAVLKDYPGKDTVQLNIINGAGPTGIMLPLTTGIERKLRTRLAALVGEDNITVQPAAKP